MSTDDNNQDEAIVDSQNNEDGGSEGNPQLEALQKELEQTKAELSKKDETIGSLKRDVKNARKEVEKTSETVNTQSDNSELLEKLEKISLKSEGITDKDEVELARKIKQESGMEMDDVLASNYFKYELEALRTEKANAEATADVKGGGTSSSAKEKPEYWIAKGTPPTREDVPDRKTRAAIVRAMVKNQKSGKTFYSD